MGRVNVPDYTDLETQMVVDMREKDGAPWRTIQSRVNGISPVYRSLLSIRRRYYRYLEAENRPLFKADNSVRAKTRNCMTCGARFRSAHSGVRMCNPCRASANVGGDFAPLSCGGIPESIGDRLSSAKPPCRWPTDRVLDGISPAVPHDSRVFGSGSRP